MRERALVTEVKDNYLKARIERHSACDSCGMCGLSKENKYVEIELINTVSAKTGDVITVEIKNQSTTKVTTIIYFLPMLLGFIFLLVAYLLSLPEWVQSLSFLGGIALTFTVLAIIDKKLKKSNFVDIKIVEQKED